MTEERLTWPRGLARYVVLADWLTDKIEGGFYAVGDYLPTEAQLCSSYDVSRYTARAAVRELKRRGLVATRHGVGTQVVHETVKAGKFQLAFDSVDEFLGSARALRLLVLRSLRKPADESVAAILGCRVGETYLHVEGRRQAAGSEQIFACSELLIPERFAGIDQHLGQGHALVSELIERHYRVSTGRIHQTIEAVNLSQRMAAALGVPRRSPGLLVRRTYFDDAQNALLHARNSHGGKNAVLSMDIRRGRD